jgi:hypothetical protein
VHGGEQVGVHRIASGRVLQRGCGCGLVGVVAGSIEPVHSPLDARRSAWKTRAAASVDADTAAELVEASTLAASSTSPAYTPTSSPVTTA